MNVPVKSKGSGKAVKPRALIVDDEADIRELLELTLTRMGLDTDCAASVEETLALLKKRNYQLCLTDMRLPDGDGLEIVRAIGEQNNRRADPLPVAVITAYGNMENAVSALKSGAFDYLAKPIGLEELRALVNSALRMNKEKTAANTDRKTGTHHGNATHGGMLLGKSPAMAKVAALIEKLAKNQAPIYISGESGSGKEVAARRIHAISARADAPFVPVNCGAIPENLMESEFFGYRKGAFTGADSDRDGFFQTARNGTLFLDEVADLPLLMQVKLLRAIQEKKVRKVGSPIEEAVNVRIISATHKNLRHCVEQGTFRQDLYYRLNVIELTMPPLRERREDLPELVETILARITGLPAPDIPKLDKSAWQALKTHPFLGNVRELENVLERATALCDGRYIRAEDLSLDQVEHSIVTPAGEILQIGDEPETERALKHRLPEPLENYLNRTEHAMLTEALKESGQDPEEAAKLLGITPESFAFRMAALSDPK
ncbi:MAG: sigma-54 dependent transcriptional regulator [Zoogloeaceae bacterium]|jgi:two-component system response regulator PilR (NtrC family)|nr:sigma-54 dependent transcriptional regulator [Zoogloeaceae bacterium]